jgi:hypothetical protein
VSFFIQRAKNGSSVPHIVLKKLMFYLATEPFQTFFSISEKASGKLTSMAKNKFRVPTLPLCREGFL